MTVLKNNIELSCCRGLNGCSRAVVRVDRLYYTALALIKKLPAIRTDEFSSGVQPHWKFRISLSCCPNGCSQPQIADIGIIAVSMPGRGDGDCSECGNCIGACIEDAVSVDMGPHFNVRCLGCGQCIDSCLGGAIKSVQTGYRVLLGGKLGRHPRLGSEMPGIYDRDGVLEIIYLSYHSYMSNNGTGRRFGDIIRDMDTPKLLDFLGAEPQAPAVMCEKNED